MLLFVMPFSFQMAVEMFEYVDDIVSLQASSRFYLSNM